jgi:hypothetical protein
VNPERTDKEINCVRISTESIFVDPRDNADSDSNTFGQYLPILEANTHIRNALVNAPSNQNTEVAGIATVFPEMGVTTYTLSYFP